MLEIIKRTRRLTHEPYSILQGGEDSLDALSCRSFFAKALGIMINLLGCPEYQNHLVYRCSPEKTYYFTGVLQSIRILLG